MTAKSLSQGEEAEVVRGVALDRLYLQSFALRLQREGSTPELANLLDVILRLDWEGAREPLGEALGYLNDDQLVALWQQLAPLIAIDLCLSHVHPDLRALSRALRGIAEARGLDLDLA